MLKAERLQKIIDQIEKDDRVILEDLGAKLHVSTDTIRRDIKELSDKGLLKAVRGGAVTNSSTHLHFKDRQTKDVQLKKIIARKAVAFIKPGQVVLVGAGTTAATVMQVLPKDIRLTVVTNSFPVVSILEDYPNVAVIFIGGELNKHSFSTSGHEAIEAFRNYRADLCLLGVCSIDLQLGITGWDHQESLVERVMVETSRSVIVLASHDKIGNADPYFVCPINAIDVLITEKEPAAAEASAFKEAGVLLK